MLETDEATRPDVVLMFSGGRDSTIAACRLAEQGLRLLLVTVTSTHLVGVNNVKQRIRQLVDQLPPDTVWIRVIQPALLSKETLYAPTCLPCQRSYIAIGTILAKSLECKSVALGYASYQGTWPEQSLHATERIAAVLGEVNVKLMLPVYDLESKEHAKQELVQRGLSSDSQEQKCLKQQFNAVLLPDKLQLEVARWEASTRTEIKALNVGHLKIVEILSFCDVHEMAK